MQPGREALGAQTSMLRSASHGWGSGPAFPSTFLLQPSRLPSFFAS